MRTIKWIITSDKMDKTVVITVESYKSHPKYRKDIKLLKNLKLMMKRINLKLETLY